ncbi:hypothetical protein HU200_026963 [Digitaria exilis]|uniref:F-box domain-containing protein n=1 Tax=Digitaria exilis TaxID=1010633 RepID=A0A835BYG8_9POAL|nr:hypothetical protein HU200_026963 [Digitaria exilis]
MSEDIVLEILLRLPVEDLLRLQTVCKAWRSIITQPRFTHMHLQRSASKNKKCLLMAPHTLDSIVEGEIWPSTFSNNIFYRWQQDDNDTASLLFAKDFHGDFRSVFRMLHRDGLVLFPTDTKVYVINPATRDVLRLPDGRRDILLPAYNNFQAVGFGLDPRTKRRIPKGLLRFRLEDETFCVVPLPASSAFDDETFRILEQGEQLYLAQYKPPQHLVIWTFCDNGSHEWIQLHSIKISGSFKILSASMLQDGLHFNIGNRLFRCDMESGDVKVVVCMDQLRYGRKMGSVFQDDSWENVHHCSWMTYTASLVPVTRAIMWQGYN